MNNQDMKKKLMGYMGLLLVICTFIKKKVQPEKTRIQVLSDRSKAKK